MDARVQSPAVAGKMQAPAENEAQQPHAYRYGPIALDVARHEVRVTDQEVVLTPKEFGLLAQFLRCPGRVMTRTILLDLVWGTDCHVTPRTIDVHIQRLKDKIPFLKWRLLSIRSLGYKLKELNFSGHGWTCSIPPGAKPARGLVAEQGGRL